MQPQKAHADAVTEIERDWVDRARALRPLLSAAAPRIEAAAALPDDVLDALHAAKMFRMILPHAFGGAELAPATFFQVICEIAAGDASTAWCIAQSAGCSMSAAYMEPRAAQEVFGDARAVVAWGYALGPQCRATPVKGGWKVNGTWGFGSGNRHASWLGGHCTQVDADGTPLRAPGGRPLERTMLFPRSSVTIKDGNWDVIGLRGTGSDTYAVTDLFVPEEFSLVARGTGRDLHLAADAPPTLEPERREKGPLYRFSPTNIYQCGFAGVGLGLARATLDAFVALASVKTPSGGSQALRDDHWIQARIAKSEARIGASRAWIREILDTMRDECAACGRPEFESRVRLRLAATHAIEEAREVVSTSYVDAGATAIFASNPFERRLRDMNAVSQQIQAHLVHYESVGQHYLGMKTGLRFI